ncbi:hypothetical protein FOA52_003750 [Chlamydomonas sp. UWO 241]|nr:hypothetical protein FOA52_003750 [Chlamydomonas sp. UWO 241]
MEAAAAAAAAALVTAAQGGTHAAYKRALDAARRFEHLAGLVAESEAVYGGRQAGANKELERAVASSPLSDVTKALEAAAQLGADPGSLGAALAAARARDAGLTRELRDAAAAPQLDVGRVEALRARAAQLGLHADAGAAQLVVQRRKASLAGELRRNAAGASAAEVAALAARAATLGMDADAAALEAGLREQQARHVAAMAAAARGGDAAAYAALHARCVHLGLGCDDDRVADARRALEGARAHVVRALHAAAAGGSLREFRAAARAAARAGCGADAELAARQLGARRVGAAAALLAVLRAQVLDVGGGPSPSGQAAVAIEGVVAALASALEEGGDAGGHGLPACAEGTVASALPAATAAAAALWPQLRACTDLGLGFNARLALSVAALHTRVVRAHAAHSFALATVSRDYWGRPQLLGWQAGERPRAEGVGEAGGSSSGGSGGTDDAVAAAGVELVRRRDGGDPGNAGGALHWVWPPPSAPAHLVCALYHRLCGAAAAAQPGGGGARPPSAPRAAGHRLPLQPLPAAQHKARRAAPSPGGAPLSRATVASLAPGVPLDALVHLDLGLEQLSGLGGLSVVCPRLASLSAASNQLTSLAGLAGLGHLRELSLRDNFLGCEAAGANAGAQAAWAALPPSLHRLHLDANGLSGLPPLPPLPLLTELSLAGNELSSVAPQHAHHGAGRAAFDGGATTSGWHPAPTLTLLAPQLTVLDLSGNALTSLAGLGVCACLARLNVSRNRLSSLGGLHACGALTDLDASANEIECATLLPWPRHEGGGAAGAAAICGGGAQHPYQLLVRLKLSRNWLTEVRDVPPLPALRSLLLQDNQLSSLCSLAAAPGITELDLSFNALTAGASAAVLAAIAPLASLSTLVLNDNPLAALAGYHDDVAAAAPWLAVLDGEALAAGDAAARATRAAARSPALVLPVLLALRSGALSVLPAPWCGTRGGSSSAVDHAGAGVAVEAAAVAQPSAAAVRAELGQARLLCAVSAAARGGLPAAGAPASLLARHASARGCHIDALPVHAGTSATRQWLEGVEAEWAAAGPLAADAARAADDSVAAAAQLLPGGGPRVGLLEPAPLPGCGPAPLLGWGDAQQQHGRLLDRKPLHAFARMAPSLRSLQLGVGAGSSGGSGGRSTAGSSGAALPPPPPPPHAAVAPLSRDGAVQQPAARAWASDGAAAAAWMRSQHCAAAQAAASRAATATRADGNGDGALVLRASYYARQLDVAGAAAAVLQAAWRARAARLLAGEYRSEAHQRRVAVAATRIQAAWRGCAARRGSVLRGLRAAASARRHAAAARIQAAARGLLVRKRLRAALSAARFVDPDLDGGGGVDGEFDFDFGAGADDLMAGLAGVGEFLAAEEPAFMADAAHALAAQPRAAQAAQPQQQQQQQQQAEASGQARAADAGVQTASSAAARSHSDHRPPSLHVPSPSGAAAAHAAPQHGHDAGQSGGDDGQPHHTNVQAWVEAHPGGPGAAPPSPALSAATSPAPWGGGPSSTVGDSASVVGVSPYMHQAGQPDSPSTSYAASAADADAAAAARAVRYRAKLEALMAEWGFADLSTAEAYYRRQQRQKAGATRDKRDAKMRDPGARLRRLQDTVDQREKLRPEDVQRSTRTGPEVALRRGSLSGPAPRPGSGEEQQRDASPPPGSTPTASVASSGRGGGGGYGQGHGTPPRAPGRAAPHGSYAAAALSPHAAAAALRGLRQSSSADAVLRSGPFEQPPHTISGTLGASPPAISDGRAHSLGLQVAGLRATPHGGGGGVGSGLLPSIATRSPGRRRSSALPGTNTDADWDAASVAASDGVLLRPRAGAGAAAHAWQKQQLMRGLGGGSSSPAGPGAAPRRSPPQHGGVGGSGRVVLPAMPGSPAVNRWVLDEDAGGRGGGGSPHSGPLEQQRQPGASLTYKGRQLLHPIEVQMGSPSRASS